VQWIDYHWRQSFEKLEGSTYTPKDTNTTALNQMLKRVQHDKKRYVIPNLFRNLEFGNDNKLIAFVLVFMSRKFTA
jgi:hypothetical protein